MSIFRRNSIKIFLAFLPCTFAVTMLFQACPVAPIAEKVESDSGVIDQKEKKDSNNKFSHKSITASSKECGQCHKQHYEEWRGSMHAYAMKDPVFHALVKKGIRETKGKLGQFCIQCHAPNASKRGMTPIRKNKDGHHEAVFDMSNTLISGGVQCVSCHTIKSVQATLNAKFTLSTKTLYGPTGSASAQAAHPMAKSDVLGQSQMCGTCHNVVNPKGALLENTFSEWYGSDFNGATPETSKSCQDCHMAAYKGPIVKNGPIRKLHRHTFVGVDQALIADFPKRKEQAVLVKKLLQSCAKIRIVRKPDFENEASIVVHVTNINNGHNLPSGSTADRQVWVHLTVKSSNGTMLFESGMFDKNGDLMDRVPGHSIKPNGDPLLFAFGQFLFNEKGEHVDFPWEASRTKDFLLPPGQTKWREYLIPKSKLGNQTIYVKATLKYRTFPPFLVQKLIKEGFLKKEKLQPIPIVDMVSTKAEFQIR